MSLTKRNVYKTPQQRDSIGLGRVCSSFLARGYCTKFNCNYLHKIPVCKYYQTPGGCWKGEQCRFNHNKNTPKLTTATASKETRYTGVQKGTKSSTPDSKMMNSNKTTESHSNPFREWTHISKLSPYECKPLPSDCPSPENPFRAGMKLEAVDRQYPGLYCVASILRVTGDELLICFDGWSNAYNYWCRFNSPEIRPIYTCQKYSLDLQHPNRGDGAQDLWNSGNGDWKEYLLNTGSSALLEEEFSPLFLPESDSRVFTLTEFSARVLLFYQIDISKLPTQLQERIENPQTCSKCETKFLIGWKSVRMFTCQEMLSHTHFNNVDTTGIFCSQKCAAIFSIDFPQYESFSS